MCAVSYLVPCGSGLPECTGCEVFGKLAGRCGDEVWYFARCLRFVADSPDSAVRFVSVWVGCSYFVVRDDFVVPVCDV